jgi:hypothetical protein
VSTEVEHDPFDRAAQREEELRERNERSAELWEKNRRQRGMLSSQVLAALLVSLPFHLWFVEWDRTGSVLVHLVLITLAAMTAAVALVGRAYRR